MNSKKRFFLGFITASCIMLSSPAKAGIPVIDSSNLAQQIQQVVAWAQQAQQMMQQITQLQQQFSQLQTMTQKLDGARLLGTILNDPSIQSTLPVDLRDAAQMLLKPADLSTNPKTLENLAKAFNIDVVANPDLGKSNADLFSRAQQILSSAQLRQAQIQQLAGRVDTSPDSKASVDLLNRNVIEVANINNQTLQTMASFEAARQAEELRRLAREQKLGADISSGLSKPVKSYTY